MNCCDVPNGMVAVAGVTAMETSTGAVTVSVDEPATLPDDAVIMLAPRAIPVAKPLELTLATLGRVEVQVAEEVKICLLPSVKVPVAMNC